MYVTKVLLLAYISFCIRVHFLIVLWNRQMRWWWCAFMEGFSVFFAIIVLWFCLFFSFCSLLGKPACFVRFFPRRICFSFFTFFLFLCNMVTGFFCLLFSYNAFTLLASCFPFQYTLFPLLLCFCFSYNMFGWFSAPLVSGVVMDFIDWCHPAGGKELPLR